MFQLRSDLQQQLDYSFLFQEKAIVDCAAIKFVIVHSNRDRE